MWSARGGGGDGGDVPSTKCTCELESMSFAQRRSYFLATPLAGSMHARRGNFWGRPERPCKNMEHACFASPSVRRAKTHRDGQAELIALAPCRIDECFSERHYQCIYRPFRVHRLPELAGSVQHHRHQAQRAPHAVSQHPVESRAHAAAATATAAAVVAAGAGQSEAESCRRRSDEGDRPVSRSLHRNVSGPG